jgi:uncharacterized protein YndB with AHSA1/START domain
MNTTATANVNPNPTATITEEEVKSHTLTLTRDYEADRTKLFRAWTDPEMLKQWFGPPGVLTLDAHVDLRVGGEYRLTLQEPGGATIVHGGVYQTIDPPDKLVFTWVLEDQGCEGSEGLFAETIVSLSFEAHGRGTRLVLTHAFLPTEASRAAHAEGWEGSLDRLQETLD